MARLSAYPVFLAVYEERRLVKAAERLCVTPSAVSHALRDFEQSLGTKLFERTSEGVQPTTAGQRLYAKVKPLVVGIEAAERELRSETAPEQTDFAFASIHTFIKAFFVPILERMHKASDPVKVRFLTRSMAATVKAVADRGSDWKLYVAAGLARALLCRAAKGNPRMFRCFACVL